MNRQQSHGPWCRKQEIRRTCRRIFQRARHLAVVLILSLGASFCLLPVLVTILFPGQGIARTAPLSLTMAYENTPLPPLYLGAGDTIPAMPGIAVELLRLVDQRIPEITITFRRVPWKRCLRELQTGTVDAIFPASYKPSRMDIGVYPQQRGAIDEGKNMISLSYSLYVVNGMPFPWNGQLTGTWRIGAPTGYSIIDDLKRSGQLVDDHSPTTRQNLRKLVAGRVQAVAAQDLTADPLIESEMQFRSITKLSPPIATKANYLLLSHQFYLRHPELAEKIWATLETIRREHLVTLSSKYRQH